MSDVYDILKKYDIKEPYCGAGVGPGWLPLIEELIQGLIALGWDKDCHQIKEKFGGLRFYIGGASEEVHNLVNEYENKSYFICETCGNPATVREDRRWLLTLCDECYRKDQESALSNHQRQP